MKKADYSDRDIVVKILSNAFEKDPHFNWLLEQSNRKDKVDITLNYVFEETMARGTVYLNDQKSAAALWMSEKTEKLSFEFIKRNVDFFFKMGPKTTFRVLKSDIITHHEYAKLGSYCYLYLIGVLPEAQGQGQASVLMNSMFAKMDSIHKPIVLETANAQNVKIYNKKGFITFKELKMGVNTLYLMKRQS